MKTVILGESDVGKSSILYMLINEKPPSHEMAATIGVDFVTKTIDLHTGQQVSAQVWDTSGTERFRTLTPSFYRGAVGAVFVYSVDSRASFEALRRWFIEYDTYSTVDDAVKILVGNKIDMQLKRQVSWGEGKRLAEQKGMLFFETSARTGYYSCLSVFEMMAETVFADPKLRDRMQFIGGPKVRTPGTVSLSDLPTYQHCANTCEII